MLCDPTRKCFHPVLAIRPVSHLSFSVVVILFHFIMLADKFSNNNNNNPDGTDGR